MLALTFSNSLFIEVISGGLDEVMIRIKEAIQACLEVCQV
jgi:hypothetical protein